MIHSLSAPSFEETPSAFGGTGICPGICFPNVFCSTHYRAPQVSTTGTNSNLEQRKCIPTVLRFMSYFTSLKVPGMLCKGRQELGFFRLLLEEFTWVFRSLCTSQRTAERQLRKKLQAFQQGLLLGPGRHMVTGFRHIVPVPF